MRTVVEKRAKLTQLQSEFLTLYNEVKAGSAHNPASINRLKAINEEASDLTEEIRQLEALDDITKSERGGGSVSIVPEEGGGGWGAVTSPRSDRATGQGGPFGKAFLDAGFNLSTKTAATVEMKAALTTTGTTPDTWNRRREPDLIARGRDERFLWPSLMFTDIADATAVEDFRQTGSRTITGSVTRDVAATTDKATLALTIDHVIEEVKTLAIVLEDIPIAVLRSIPNIEQFLNVEARFAVEQALDVHVMAQITAATPPSGLSGANLFEQVRNAIGAMRLLGTNPDLLVLNPTDAAGLDLTMTADGIFILGHPSQIGNNSELWGVRVVEHTTTAGNEPPMLIDSRRIGMLYRGLLRFEADPYTNFKKNLVNLRFEGNALFHVRDANAAYVIEAAA